MDNEDANVARTTMGSGGLRTGDRRRDVSESQHHNTLPK